MKTFAFLALLAAANAHMMVSTPAPQWGRSPPVNLQNPLAQNCAGHKYTWIWSPTLSGSCEIYMNCWTELPASPLKMSGGASHGGGPCKIYYCPDEITVPECNRGSLPEQFDGCTAIASHPDCAAKGEFVHTLPPGAVGPPTPAPPPVPPVVFPTGGTKSKIRCGLSHNEATDKCGTECASSDDCIYPEKCFAALRDCEPGSDRPVDKPNRIYTPGPQWGLQCVSIVPHVTDGFCRSVMCDPIFWKFCDSSPGTASKQSPNLSGTNICHPYATFENQTWTDVGLIWDVAPEELKLTNPWLNPNSLVLDTDTVLEIPGDCELAFQEANAAGRIAPEAALVTAAFAVAMACAI